MFKHELCDPYQYAFLSKRSTTAAAVDYIEDLLTRELYDALQIYWYSKAIYTVNQWMVFTKINNIEFWEVCNKVLESYLQDRE